MNAGGGAVVADEHTSTSSVLQFSLAVWRSYQHLLDKSTPLVLYRWIFMAAIASVYALRVYVVEGFYIITYGLGIYILQLLIAFLSPQVDPEIHGVSDGPALPRAAQKSFAPSSAASPSLSSVVHGSLQWVKQRLLVPNDMRRHSLIKAFFVAFILTFFSAFDVPVFWPILLFYWSALFILTMRRQIIHMIKYKYIPITFGKQRYGKKEAPADETSTVRP